MKKNVELLYDEKKDEYHAFVDKVCEKNGTYGVCVNGVVCFIGDEFLVFADYIRDRFEVELKEKIWFHMYMSNRFFGRYKNEEVIIVDLDRNNSVLCPK